MRHTGSGSIYNCYYCRFTHSEYWPCVPGGGNPERSQHPSTLPIARTPLSHPLDGSHDMWELLLRQNSQLCGQENISSVSIEAFWKFLLSLRPNPTSLQGPPTWPLDASFEGEHTPFCITVTLPTLTFDRELPQRKVCGWGLQAYS